MINNYLPMYGITMAFREPDFSLDNVLNSPFNGFENFKFLFENDQLGLYIRNTVLYNVVFLILNIVIPVTMAILFANIFTSSCLATDAFLPLLFGFDDISNGETDNQNDGGNHQIIGQSHGNHLLL